MRNRCAKRVYDVHSDVDVGLLKVWLYGRPGWYNVNEREDCRDIANKMNRQAS